MGKFPIKCNILTFAILYLAVPIMLFFLFWLQLPWGGLFFVLLGYACYRFNQQEAEGYQELPKSCANELALAFLLVLVYLLLTGHGSFLGAEGYDIPWRSAIYQDLIHQSWPVVYEASHSALVYYLVYWLVPAGISSVLDLGEIGSNLILVIWTYIGLRLFLLLLFNYLKIQRNQIIIVTLMFLFWSGLNFIGSLIVGLNWTKPLAIESNWGWNTWWYTNTYWSVFPMSYMVRTVFDSLGNIYNQFTPVLLGLMLFLLTRQTKYYALIGLLVLPFSPFGFLGLFVLLVGFFCCQLREASKKHAVMEAVKQAASKENALAALSVFPVFFLYFTGNSSAGDTYSIFSAPLEEYGIYRMSILLLYYCLQFGIFMGLVYKTSQDKKLWWIAMASLILFPLFRIGNGCDLCWNGSIPAFFLVMIFVMRYILDCWNNKIYNKRFFLVYSLVIIAALTPLLQMNYSVRQCVQLGIPLVRNDTFAFGDTLSKVTPEEANKKFRNFLTQNYEKKAFYRYLAKKR